MHRDEKHALYSFLGLYLISSFFLLFISAFWYYNAQKQMHGSLTFYKIQSLSEKINSSIVNAHMHNTVFVLPSFDAKRYRVGLFDKEKHLRYGNMKQSAFTTETFEINDGVATLVSKGATEHLGIAYTIIQDLEHGKLMYQLKKEIAIWLMIIAILIALLSYFLTRIFLRPVISRRERKDRFIKDTTHELNTPITSLMMSTKRFMDKKIYDEKLLKNISISTKQLYDLYTSIAYLSFGIKESDSTLDLSVVLNESVEYYRELLEKKHIDIILDIEPYTFSINHAKLLKLFGNLISNAIKYSPPESHIIIRLKSGKFSIQDFGIGIAEDEFNTIFKRYSRSTNYSGGFGIGLNIVADICQEYGLNIKVASELNKGSQFSIDFNIV